MHVTWHGDHPFLFLWCLRAYAYVLLEGTLQGCLYESYRRVPVDDADRLIHQSNLHVRMFGPKELPVFLSDRYNLQLHYHQLHHGYDFSHDVDQW